MAVAGRNALSKYGVTKSDLSDADAFVVELICNHGADNKNWVFLPSTTDGFALQRQRLFASNSNHFRVFDVSNGIVIELDPRLYDIHAAEIFNRDHSTRNLKIIDNEERVAKEKQRFIDYFESLRSQMVTSRELSPVLALYSYNAGRTIQQDGVVYPAFSLTYDEADALIRRYFWFNLSPRASGVISSRQNGIFYTYHFGT